MARVYAHERDVGAFDPSGACVGKNNLKKDRKKAVEVSGSWRDIVDVAKHSKRHRSADQESNQGH